MRMTFIQRFLHLESSGGIILFLAAIFAIAVTNSSYSYYYQMLAHQLEFIVNDGLMSIFFLIVGLELKRHYIEKRFSHFSQIVLPGVAAVGGMIVPALIYLLMTYPDGTALKGWAIPVATDIAFALAALSLFGKRVPISLKLFLLLLAIFDDVGAIIVIALFYSNTISIAYLMLATLILLFLWLLAYLQIYSSMLYVLLGIGLWSSVYYSGIHPTLAGVLFALMLPTHDRQEISLLYRFESWLHPYVTYFILPLFAWTNMGFSFAGFSLSTLNNKVLLGIVAGLFLGKQVGVFGLSWLVIRLGWAKLPAHASWGMLYGVAVLCGIGFTMSLFLGTLSFQNEMNMAMVRFGVFGGSILSALVGSFILYQTLRG